MAAIKTGDDITRFDTILKFLKLTPVGWAVNWLLKKIGFHTFADWIGELEDGLTTCLNVIDEEENWHDARCRVALGTVGIEVFGVPILGPYPDPFADVETSYCAEYYGGSGHRCIKL